MAKRILIVDDNPEMVEMLRFALHSEGYAIRTAVTAREALKKALALDPNQADARSMKQAMRMAARMGLPIPFRRSPPWFNGPSTC